MASLLESSESAGTGYLYMGRTSPGELDGATAEGGGRTLPPARSTPSPPLLQAQDESCVFNISNLSICGCSGRRESLDSVQLIPSPLKPFPSLASEGSQPPTVPHESTSDSDEHLQLENHSVQESGCRLRKPAACHTVQLRSRVHVTTSQKENLTANAKSYYQKQENRTPLSKRL